ncbi:class 1 fructose-bisphosphatase [Euzebya tangerina]|uniref:class 1 fructose-bisphosphatase n=1 Tax=Euzebya tangerina TaxID=591198 RepID=UPI000E30DE23|nr:class 1 fructose-bisphosphatase [Euzebya tangerina]
MSALDPDPGPPPVGGEAAEVLVTIERFLADQQPGEASGTLTRLLEDIALAGKLIASRTRRAGLTELLGKAGVVNVQGEDQKLLDVYADEVMTSLLGGHGRVCAIVSEEQAEVRVLDPDAPYVVVHDPMDGSSNIDANVSIGTIFGVFRREDPTAEPVQTDWLRPGRDLVAAGYVLYGTSTMLVYSVGQGVHAFTLDPEVGEFLGTWTDLRFPDDAAYYSLNFASLPHWDSGMTRFVEWLNRDDTPTLSQRYIGSAVADFHRNLLHGGVYGYPGEIDRPEGKLRLVYEGAPLAFLAAQAGGRGSDGARDLLDITPTDLHERTPVFLGNADLVDQLERCFADGE